MFSAFVLYHSSATAFSVLWGGSKFIEANLNDNYLGCPKWEKAFFFFPLAMSAVLLDVGWS